MSKEIDFLNSISGFSLVLFLKISKMNFIRLLLGECLTCFHCRYILFSSLLGGFYSDDEGYVGTSCKRCPNGSFVTFDKAPGIRKSDCKSCPSGNDEPSNNNRNYGNKFPL